MLTLFSRRTLTYDSCRHATAVAQRPGKELFSMILFFYPTSPPLEMSTKLNRDFRHAGLGPSTRSCLTQERCVTMLYCLQHVLIGSKLAVYSVSAKSYTSNVGAAAVNVGRHLEATQFDKTLTPTRRFNLTPRTLELLIGKQYPQPRASPLSEFARAPSVPDNIRRKREAIAEVFGSTERREEAA